MKLEELLAKIANGEKLTDEEKEFIKNYKEPEPDPNRIPKSRLDEEIAKRKEAESRGDELQAKLSELEAKVEELNTKGMSEAEKAKRESAKTLKALQEQVAALTKERDESKAKADAMEYRGKVTELAKSRRFTDIDYLEYKLQSAKVNLDDQTAVAGFFGELEKSAPHLFESAAKAGSGSSDNKGGSGASAYQSRIDELLAKPSLSTRESQEVIDLQTKIEAEKSGGSASGNANGGTTA
ncbi:MAG: hypothetical protein J5654_09655 [Victivallales bacterium]|nr:hypothetical protein [Victivallales bacterium]